MSKVYQVEAKFQKNRWTLIETFTRQTDALHYTNEYSAEKYAIRIIRVVRTVVFEDKK